MKKHQEPVMKEPQTPLGMSKTHLSWHGKIGVEWNKKLSPVIIERLKFIIAVSFRGGRGGRWGVGSGCP